MPLDLVVEDVVAETKTGVAQETELGERLVPSVLVVDADSSYYNFYRQNLGPIVGLRNIKIINDVPGALKALKEIYFSAHIIDPFLQGGSRDDWGLDVADHIRHSEGNYDLVWLFSDRHDLLKEGEGKGVGNIYTKKDPAQADGYKTKEQLISDIKIVLGGSGGSISDTH